MSTDNISTKKKQTRTARVGPLHKFHDQEYFPVYTPLMGDVMDPDGAGPSWDEVWAMSKEAGALYADAHNTYNACGKLPSELLSSVNELVEALERARNEMKAIADYLTYTKNADAMQIAGDMVADNPRLKQHVRDIDDVLSKYKKT